MRREYASIAAMAALLVGSQAVAIALSPLFQGGGYQAFPNPSDVTNTAIYVILILVFTGVILGLVRYRRQNLAKYVIMASIFITLAFILLLPLYYGLYYATGENPDPNFQNTLANVATVISFGIAALLVYVLVKFPEWYVVDSAAFVTAAGVTAILGISFAAIPAFTFLTAPGRSFAGLAPNAFVALGTVLGSLVGFFFLMRFVLKGNPQAGLPLLNGGALLGFLLTNLLAFGYLNLG